MNPFDPANIVTLLGTGTLRGVTIALPTDRVRDLLPNGLELGPQNVTPPGTHPVLIEFNDMFRLHTSLPSLLPSITYHELSVGVPFSYVTSGRVYRGAPGPYYFMPKLFLDNYLAVLGGVLGWGFNKQLANIVVTADRYSVASGGHKRTTCLAWPTRGDERPLRDFPLFEPVRQMMSQPVISLMPAGLGPFFVLSDFDKKWDEATLRPLRTFMEVDVEYVPGLPAGRHPAKDVAPGIDESVLGSFELRSPWRLNMPYPAPLRV